jgi:hypothetical protein
VSYPVLLSHAHALMQVDDERIRQDQRWGEQNHADGTGAAYDVEMRDAKRAQCDDAFLTGLGTWRHILEEEVAEAFAEEEPENLRAELIQVAAVAVAWVEAIDRRTGGGL